MIILKMNAPKKDRLLAPLTPLLRPAAPPFGIPVKRLSLVSAGW